MQQVSEPRWPSPVQELWRVKTRHRVLRSWSSPRESPPSSCRLNLFFDRRGLVAPGKPPVREAPLLLRCHLVASAEERIPSDV